MDETDKLTDSIKPDSSQLSQRVFRVILAIIALVAVATGLLGMLPHGVAHSFHGSNLNHAVGSHVILDSNYRYYSGLWLGAGVVMLSIIPTIEKQRTPLRMLSIMIFLGGIGRVLSMITFAIPHPAFIFFTLVELFFPFLLVWQGKLNIGHAKT